MTALVIGGGVAGIATVGWLDRYEAPYDWVDASGELGGMLRSVHNPIIEYPGVHGQSGGEIADAIAKWAEAAIPGPRGASVERIVQKSNGGFDVTIDGSVAAYDAVVVATGTRRRMLGVPGEVEGLGDYVLMSTTQGPARFKGHPVAIVGGADAAVEGALNLAAAGAWSVTILARSAFNAQRHFVASAEANPAISRYDGDVEVTRIEPATEGCRVHLSDGNHLDVRAVFVRIGVEPVMPVIDADVKTDQQGFIVVNERCESNVAGLYAVGDVISTPLRSVATCVGDGARAGRSVAEALGIWT